MFKQAIDDKMVAAVMQESSLDTKKEIIEYANRKKKGKVVIVPQSPNKANEFILRYAKIFQNNIRENKIYGNIRERYAISSNQLYKTKNNQRKDKKGHRRQQDFSR